MLMSMTGFGRSAIDAPFGRLIVEIQSVNRKYLDIFVSMPREFSRFEQNVREWIGEKLSRGQLSVKIHLIPSAETVQGLLPEAKLLRSLKKGWETISAELGFDPKKIDLNFLMQHLPSLQKVEFAQDEDLPILQASVEEALKTLLAMKSKEGGALAKDAVGRLKGMERLVAEIEGLAPDAAARMRQKLMEKMGEILKAGPETEERLFREAALFAEKVDISEEIARLKSHFAQFEELLRAKSAGAVGRKMDFLIQEMSREINTIGSKSLDANISRFVVEMKSELEKMREQIQNIE